MRYYSKIVTPFSTPLFDFEMLKGRSREPVDKRRLAIVLHGKGDSLEAFQSIPEELGLFDFDFLILNAPMKFGDGFKWMNDEPRHLRSLEIVRDLLLSLVEEIKDFGYQTQNVLWLGHSQGGRVASDLVMHSPDSFLGLVAVSSYVGFFDGWADGAEEANAAGAWKTPWLITHGTEDRIIRLREIRNDVRELTRGKIPVTYREFAKGHDFDYEREVPYIRDWIRRQAPVVRGLRVLNAPANSITSLAKTPTPRRETDERKTPEA
ncbi:hypothetical protein BH10BDE1_BH10BDE1_03860 [soil metagenome]